MSGGNDLSNLPEPIKGLVQAFTSQSTSDALPMEEGMEVQEWIGKAARPGAYSQPTDLKELDATLTSKTYLVGNAPTAADIALYGSLHPIISKLPPPAYYSHPSVTRFFDRIQNLPSVRAATAPLALVPFDLENAPRVDRQVEAPKKKVKKETPAAAEASASSAPSEPAAEQKLEKKDKKEKPKKETAAGAPPAAKPAKGASAPPAASDDSGEPSPSMIDLRVGHIVAIQKHPDADGLYVEQINVGEEEPRTVVSGLVHYIPIEQMRDRKVIVVCNLKPANMRGVKSHAMVLCATSKDGKEAGIELVGPPADAQPGDRVYFEGDKYKDALPLPQLNPKKKIFETIQPGFTTLETREAAWVDPVTKTVHKLLVGKDSNAASCKAPTLIGASLS